MRIGVVKEIKNSENRVALTPSGAQALHQAGHTVLVQGGAGLGSGFSDEAYLAAGATIVAVEQAWEADLVMKVKEPLESEYPYLKDQMLFTYFHLAGGPTALTEVLLAQNTTAIAYETVEDAAGKLPLLAPMSAVAGNIAITVGNYYLAKFNRGKGTLLGSVLGKRYGKVVIIGDGWWASTRPRRPTAWAPRCLSVAGTANAPPNSSERSHLICTFSCRRPIAWPPI